MKLKLVVILTYLLFNLSLNGQITLTEFQEMFLNNSKQSTSIRYKKELINRNYKSSMNTLNPTIMFSLSLQYSKSISPITQPDGTIKDLGIHNISIAPTLTTTIPIWITGGTLSITNSLRYYRNINPQNAYSNYSLNYYYISFSQPLSFFSNDKWNRKSTIASLKMSKYQNSQERLKLKSLATNFFFNILNLDNEIECVQFQLALSIASKVFGYTCPKCGNHGLTVFPATIACECCGFSIPRHFHGYDLTDKDIEQLVRYKYTSPIYGFTNAKGRKFCESLVIDNRFGVTFSAKAAKIYS